MGHKAHKLRLFADCKTACDRRGDALSIQISYSIALPLSPIHDTDTLSYRDSRATVVIPFTSDSFSPRPPRCLFGSPARVLVFAHSQIYGLQETLGLIALAPLAAPRRCCLTFTDQMRCPPRANAMENA